MLTEKRKGYPVNGYEISLLQIDLSQPSLWKRAWLSGIMGHLVTLATCSLNQWALDFEGNAERIIESIRIAKAAGATLRVGPELEITGYDCLDHFLEGDTFLHSWEMLARIIDHEDCQDILLDIGMPVRHQNVRYNCRVIVLNRKVLLIRPKMFLANDGNYREMRYFTPWNKPREIQDYYLESIVGKISGQAKVPFGDGVISTIDTALGCETCEELFTPSSPHISMSLAGVEIFTNSSGSHFELRKLQHRVSLILEGTKKAGGIYLYSNLLGCGGERVGYDGCSMIIINGMVVAQGSQFSLSPVEVVTATCDLEDVRSFRTSPSRGMQASQNPSYTRIEADIRLSRRSDELSLLQGPSEEIDVKYYTPQEEIALAPAIYLWLVSARLSMPLCLLSALRDYLRRCGGIMGYFLPLSGGIDSCATACIVFSMCHIVHKAVDDGEDQVINDLRRLCGEPAESKWLPKSAQEICNRIFSTCYMGTVNSSEGTRGRAGQLAKDIGANHVDLNLDIVVSALTKCFTAATGFSPRFTSHGGSKAENLALQKYTLLACLRLVL